MYKKDRERPLEYRDAPRPGLQVWSPWPLSSLQSSWCQCSALSSVLAGLSASTAYTVLEPDNACRPGTPLPSRTRLTPNRHHKNVFWGSKYVITIGIFLNVQPYLLGLRRERPHFMCDIEDALFCQVMGEIKSFWHPKCHWTWRNPFESMITSMGVSWT